MIGVPRLQVSPHGRFARTPVNSPSGVCGRGVPRQANRRLPKAPAVESFERLDRGADLAQDRADLSTEEDQGDDRDDRDEGEDQRVLGETLAFLVTTKERDKSSKHLETPPFRASSPPYVRRRAHDRYQEVSVQ